MSRFSILTRYIPEFRSGNYGDWFIDSVNKDYPHSPLAMSYVRYSPSVMSFCNDLLNFCSSTPEFRAENYSETLRKQDLESLNVSDLEKLNEKELLALIVGAFRSDYFCSGSFLEYLKNGDVLRWLERLSDLDEGLLQSGTVDILNENLLSSDAEAIVNAANTELRQGGGVCGAIFNKAGCEQMRDACDALGSCPTGSAVTTPSFDIGCKAVIHAVGPKWEGGDADEEEYLYHVYQSALNEAVENHCQSVAFPLISAGIYGYPKEPAWETALSSVLDYFMIHPEYPLSVRFHVLTKEDLDLGNKVLEKVKNRSSAHTASQIPVIPFSLDDDKYSYMDNSFQSSFEFGGKKYTCVDQYLMEQKALLAGDYETAAKIMRAKDPKQMKAYGSYIRCLHSAEWDGLKQLLAYNAVLEKFKQNKKLAAKLLSTGEAIPAYCSTEDTEWGTGLSRDDHRLNNPDKWKGQNLLGFILQSVRSDLRQNHFN